MAAEKRRKARSTTALTGAVLNCGKDTPEAILQAGATLAAGTSGGGSATGSKPKTPKTPGIPDVPKPRQAAHLQPDLREHVHPEVAECGVGDGTADSRTWDGTTDAKRAQAIIRSRMSFSPPVPGVYDHAPWATKTGPRLRELLRLMQGEVYREGILAGSQDRTDSKEGTTRHLLRSRVENMGGVSNIDPEDIVSIEQITDSVWIEEPDFEGNWVLAPVYAARVQAALELYSNERAMDLLMSWLLDPVTGDELDLVHKLESPEDCKKYPQELILRLRVHVMGGLDSIHPNDEQLLRQILVSRVLLSTIGPLIVHAQTEARWLLCRWHSQST